MLNTTKAFLCGALFLFSLVWTRNYIGDVVFFGELPSLAYAISASISSMTMLGSILWGIKLGRNAEPRGNRKR